MTQIWPEWGVDDHLFSAVLLYGSWISTRQGSLLYRMFHMCHDTNITCAWQTQCLVLNRLPKGNHSTQCPLATSPHLIGSKWGSKLPILSIEPRSVPHHTDDLVKILILKKILICTQIPGSNILLMEWIKLTSLSFLIKKNINGAKTKCMEKVSTVILGKNKTLFETWKQGKQRELKAMKTGVFQYIKLQKQLSFNKTYSWSQDGRFFT